MNSKNVIRINARALISAFLLLSLLANNTLAFKRMNEGTAPESFNDDCNPTAGDQAFDWVANRAGNLSRELSQADYKGRIFNYMLLGFDDINHKIEHVSSELHLINDEVTTVEKGLAELSEVAAAIRRQDHAQQTIDRLIILHQELELARERNKTLMAVPSFDEFHNQGLHHVGRETLINEFQEIGDSADRSLKTKFNAYAGVTFDEKGNVKDAKVTFQPGMVDVLVTAIAVQFLGAKWGAVAAIVFQLGKAGVNFKICHDRVEAQRKRLREAFNLLPTQLMTTNALYDIYRQTYVTTLTNFQQNEEKITSAFDALDGRWRELLAFNILRDKTAQSVLTAEKVDMLRKQFEKNDAVRSIFDNIALRGLSKDIANFSEFLARQRRDLQHSCRNVDGLIALEDYIDSLSYAREAFSHLQSLPAFAPLKTNLDINIGRIDQSLPLAKGRFNSPFSQPCKPSDMGLSVSNITSRKIAQSLSRKLQILALKTNTNNRLSFQPNFTSSISSTLIGSIDPTTSPADGRVACVLVSTGGGGYQCNVPNGGGTPYANSFDNSGHDPLTDVLLHSNDGGYSGDNRHVSVDIDKVNSNLQERIADLENRLAGPRQALPEWLSRNASFLSDISQFSETELGRQLQTRTEFTQNNAQAVASARAAVDDFVRSPFDKGRLTRFFNDVGGKDASLPNLEGDVIVPTAPSVRGITALDRVYGERTDNTIRSLMRERMKMGREIPVGDNYRPLAEDYLDTAELFHKGSSDSGEGIADILKSDAAALRYNRTGLLKKVFVTTVDNNGRFKRVAVDDISSLPENALINRIHTFQNKAAGLKDMINGIREALPSGEPSTSRRLDILNSTERVVTKAGKLFFDGDVVGGTKMLDVSRQFLNQAANPNEYSVEYADRTKAPLSRGSDILVNINTEEQGVFDSFMDDTSTPIKAGDNQIRIGKVTEPGLFFVRFTPDGRSSVWHAVTVIPTAGDNPKFVVDVSPTELTFFDVAPENRSALEKYMSQFSLGRLNTAWGKIQTSFVIQNLPNLSQSVVLCVIAIPEAVPTGGGSLVIGCLIPTLDFAADAFFSASIQMADDLNREGKLSTAESLLVKKQLTFADTAAQIINPSGEGSLERNIDRLLSVGQGTANVITLDQSEDVQIAVKFLTDAPKRHNSLIWQVKPKKH